MQKGDAGYVLPRFENTQYIKIEKGDHFGIIDLVFDESMLPKNKHNFHLKLENKKESTRLFCVQAQSDCEILILKITDIFKMKVDYPDEFDELFENAVRLLKKTLQLKIEAIKLCEVNTNSNNAMSNN